MRLPRIPRPLAQVRPCRLHKLLRWRKAEQRRLARSPITHPSPSLQALATIHSALAPDEQEDSSIFSDVREVPICLGAPVLSSLLQAGEGERADNSKGQTAHVFVRGGWKQG